MSSTILNPHKTEVIELLELPNFFGFMDTSMIEFESRDKNLLVKP